MTLSIKTERSMLTQDELETIARTHYPVILDADDKDLSAIQQRVRTLVDKERTLFRDMRRSIRGKADTRGASFPGNIEKPARRKQVFLAASKRISKELARRSRFEQREAWKQARSPSASRSGDAPSSQRPDHVEMTTIENRKLLWRINRARVGSISQAGRRAQAARDSRGG